ncbi:hypothetical protein ACTPEF_26490, partial [Clostridioides difficile]
KELIDIPKMAKECKSMMSQTREALILFDASIAYDVGTKDDIVPVMPINTNSSELFTQRGGRIPAPIHSFKN